MQNAGPKRGVCAGTVMCRRSTPPVVPARNQTSRGWFLAASSPVGSARGAPGPGRRDPPNPPCGHALGRGRGERKGQVGAPAGPGAVRRHGLRLGIGRDGPVGAAPYRPRHGPRDLLERRRDGARAGGRGCRRPRCGGRPAARRPHRPPRRAAHRRRDPGVRRRRGAVARDAYAWPVWGAAYLVEGGCSDDAFMDFRDGLVLAGRATFERTLADPDTLADHPVVAAMADAGSPWFGFESLDSLVGTRGPARPARTTRRTTRLGSGRRRAAPSPNPSASSGTSTTTRRTRAASRGSPPCSPCDGGSAPGAGAGRVTRARRTGSSGRTPSGPTRGAPRSRATTRGRASRPSRARAGS